MSLSNREREVSEMNGYTMMADSYKMLMEQGKIDKKTAEKYLLYFLVKKVK